MTDGATLKQMIDDSGVTIVHIAEKLGCSRNRVYAILNGAECSASEIMAFSELLRLKKPVRDQIFLANSVN